MSAASFHLAQLNIGTIRAPVTDPIMADFMGNLAAINALAENSPGFVWRLQTEDGDATALRPYDDDRILVNMSVWQSVETLFDYVYQSQHTAFLRRRAEWFQKMDTPIMVLWWIPAGHIPSVQEAKIKLESLQQNGPSPAAFTFKQRFTIEDMLKQSI